MKRKTTRERVLAALRVKHLSVAAGDLAEEVGARLPAVKAALRDLRSEGIASSSWEAEGREMRWRIVSVPIRVIPEILPEKPL